LQKLLVKTEREAIEWVHHRNRAAKLDHFTKKVKDCTDGDCAKVTE
jgi:hypothetical protein